MATLGEKRKAQMAELRSTVVRDTQKAVAYSLVNLASSRAANWENVASKKDSIFHQLLSVFSGSVKEAPLIASRYHTLNLGATLLFEIDDPVKFKVEHAKLLAMAQRAAQHEARVRFLPIWGRVPILTPVPKYPALLQFHPRFQQLHNSFNLTDPLAPEIIQDLGGMSYGYTWYGHILSFGGTLAALSAFTLVPWQFAKSKAPAAGTFSFLATLGIAAGMHYKANACYRASGELDALRLQDGQALLTLAEEMAAGTELDPKKSFQYLNRKLIADKERVAKTLPRSLLFKDNPPAPLYFLSSWGRAFINLQMYGYDGPWRQGYEPTTRIFGGLLHATGLAGSKPKHEKEAELLAAAEQALHVAVAQNPEIAQDADEKSKE